MKANTDVCSAVLFMSEIINKSLLFVQLTSKLIIEYFQYNKIINI